MRRVKTPILETKLYNNEVSQSDNKATYKISTMRR